MRIAIQNPYLKAAVVNFSGNAPVSTQTFVINFVNVAYVTVNQQKLK